MPTSPETAHLLAGNEKKHNGGGTDETTIENTNAGHSSVEPAGRSKKSSLWSDTNRSQKFTLLYAAIGTIAIYTCQAIPQPFLSRVVVSKGGQRLYAAAIIHSTYLFASVASLVCGKYQSKLPTKKCVWIGILMLGITQACFGFLQYLDDITAFLVIGFLVKAIQGVGFGIFNVATLILLWHEIPDHVEKSFGMTKATAAVGFLIGPTAGGFLYSIKNEIMIPFTASAITPVLLAVIGWIILPNVEGDTKGENYQTWKCICNPKSMIALGLASTCGAAFAVYDASFTSYAQTMGISVVTVGFMFSVAEVFVIIANSLSGYYGNANDICREVLMITFFFGMFGMTFSFISGQTALILYIKVSVFSALSATVQTLSFPEMIYQSVKEIGDLADNFSFRSKLSGVWYFVLTLSMFVFGVIGTGLQNLIPYSVSLSITTLAGLSLTLIVAGLIWLYRCSQK